MSPYYSNLSLNVPGTFWGVNSFADYITPSSEHDAHIAQTRGTDTCLVTQDGDESPLAQIRPPISIAARVITPPSLVLDSLRPHILHQKLFDVIRTDVFKYLNKDHILGYKEEICPDELHDNLLDLTNLNRETALILYYFLKDLKFIDFDIENIPCLKSYSHTFYDGVNTVDKEWTQQLQDQIKILPSLSCDANDISIEQVGDPDSPVFRITQPNQDDQFFRPVIPYHSNTFSYHDHPIMKVSINTHAARLTLAAARLNSLLGIKACPNAKIVVIDGIIGTLSEKAPGTSLTRDDLSERFDRASYESKSMRNLEAFEFLVGNYFSHYANFHTDADAKVMGFDYDKAFQPSLGRVTYYYWSQINDKPAYRSHSPFGHLLPEDYNASFIRQLKALTPQRIREEFSDILCETEIVGLIFRRGLLLLHAQTKPQF